MMCLNMLSTRNAMQTDVPWQVQVATALDTSDITQLVNSAYRGEGSKRGWTTEADILGGQRTDLQSIGGFVTQNNSVILVVRNEAKKLVACVCLEKKEPDLAYLGMLTVNPSLQKSGLGKFLLKAAEEYVEKSWKIHQLEMTVISVRHELIEWYQRRGYILSSERRPFPMKDPRFGIPKSDFLEFVVLSKRV